MNFADSLAEKLDQLDQSTPKDYFHGLESQNLCKPDNVIAFLRTNRAVLKERTFESRPHHRYVLILNFQTSGSISVDGTVYRLNPGEAFLVAPYQFHFYLDVQERDIKWLFLTFEAENPETLIPISNRPIEFDEQVAKGALSITRRFEDRLNTTRSAANQAILEAASILDLLQNQKQSSLTPFSQTPVSQRDSVMVQKVNRLLHERLSEGIDITEIAARLSLSERYLRKRFQALTGLTLGSYFIHYKLDRAVKRLVHSDATLTEIAVDCGYESLASFSRGFKTKLGLTPSSYRARSRTR